jgi:toxin FitB
VIVLDTNVLSEAARPKPSPAVLGWLAAQPAAQLFTTTISEGEMLCGLALLLEGRRRVALEEAARQMFAEDFAERILPFDSAAAQEFAAIAAARRRQGRPMATLDAQIAAIARAHRAALATRNVADFASCGIEVIDPWSS